jgi:hypothetical protein
MLRAATDVAGDEEVALGQLPSGLQNIGDRLVGGKDRDPQNGGSTVELGKRVNLPVWRRLVDDKGPTSMSPHDVSEMRAGHNGHAGPADKGVVQRGEELAAHTALETKSPGVTIQDQLGAPQSSDE